MKRTDITKLFDKPQWYDEYGQRVLDVLLNGDQEDGVSAISISAKLGIDPDLVTETLRRLSFIDMAEHSGVVRGKQYLYVPTDIARRSVADRRYRPKLRKCLTCPDTFLSTGAHHRICDACKAYDLADEGGIAA